MPGTKEGAAKRRATMIAKAGGEAAYLELQRRQASKGGRNSNASGNPTNFGNNPELARKAGKRGGKAKKTTYANEADGQTGAKRGTV